MPDKQNRSWGLLMLVAAGLTTFFAMGAIATSPWHIIPEMGGDGGKNVFAYLYHVLYDKGIWFTGMNYPYGEHIVFADGQTALSVPLSYCKWLTLQQAFAIMWSGIMLSYVVSVMFLYKIFMRLALHPAAGIVFAILITFCAPQVLRVSGHYALAYSCVLPMLLYWTLSYHANPKVRYAIYFFAAGMVMSLMHPYYAGMALIFAGFYSLSYLVANRQPIVQRIRHCMPLLLSAIGSMSVLFGFMHLTDPATDRPATPYGILENCTTPKEILTSAYSPYWSFLKERFHVSHICDGGEGYMYPGLVALFIIALSALLWIAGKLRKKRIDVLEPNQFPDTFKLMAVLVLLFAMGVPFVCGLPGLLNYFSIFKQFRTLGRFSWITYYIATNYAAVALYHWYHTLRQSGRLPQALMVLFIGMILWATEAGGYITFIRQQAREGYKNYDAFFQTGAQNWSGFLQAHHYRPNDFQAIIVTPFFEVGSEKIWVNGSGEATAWGMAMGAEAGLQLHLPLADGMLSRTSWAVANRQVKIIGGPFTDKAALVAAHLHKPFLLLNADTADATDPDKKYLYQGATYLGHFQHAEVYVCYADTILAHDKLLVDSVNAIAKYMPVGDTCIGNCGNWMVQHFDTGRFKPALFGKVAQTSFERDNMRIAAMKADKLTAYTTMEFSCWFLLSAADYKSPWVTVEMLDEQGRILRTTDIDTKQSTDSKGAWYRAGGYFIVPPHTAAISVLLHDEGNSYLAIDELVIRPANALIISKDEKGTIFANNHNITQ